MGEPFCQAGPPGGSHKVKEGSPGQGCGRTAVSSGAELALWRSGAGVWWRTPHRLLPGLSQEPRISDRLLEAGGKAGGTYFTSNAWSQFTGAFGEELQNHRAWANENSSAGRGPPPHCPKPFPFMLAKEQARRQLGQPGPPVMSSCCPGDTREGLA